MENTHETEAQAIEENVSEVAEQPEVEQQEQAENQQDDEQPEGEQPEGEQSEDDGTKKLSNALNKQKRANNKLRAQREQAQQEIERLKKQLEDGSGKEEAEPTEDGFDSYADYLKARADWAGKNSFSEHSRKNTEEQISNLESQKEALWANERMEHLSEKVKHVSAEYPDYMDVHQNNVESVNKMPEELQKTFLSLDNAPLAFYNLVKEGRLEDLTDLPADVARTEIIQAQYRKPPKPAKATSAPAPMKAATGKGKQHKSLADFDPREIVDWAKK